MTKLRVGPHHQFGGGALTVKMLSRAALAIAVGDLGVLAEASADCVTIGRLTDDGAFDGQSFDCNRYWAQGVSPEHMANRYLAYLSEPIRLNPWVKVWHGPNEQHPDQAADPVKSMQWYGEFSYHFCRLIAERGRELVRTLKAGVGAWATGTPEPDLLRHYKRALEGIRAFGGIHLSHCYSDLNDSHAYRYRAQRAVFLSLGFDDIPQAVTEAGAEGSGTMQPFATQFGGSLDLYWGYLKPLIDGYHQDGAYFLGACLFTTGGAETWSGHNYTFARTASGQDLGDLLGAYTPPAPVKPKPSNQAVFDAVGRVGKTAGENLIGQMPHDLTRAMLAARPAQYIGGDIMLWGLSMTQLAAVLADLRSRGYDI